MPKGYATNSRPSPMPTGR